MKHNPPLARQLHLGFLPQRVPGAADWGALDPARRAEALAILARLIARAAGLEDEEGTRDD